MKISTKLILITTILATSSFAGNAPEPAEEIETGYDPVPTKEYDLVLEKGGTVANGSILTMNGSNIQTLQTLTVSGSIVGTGTIDGDVQIDQGGGNTSFGLTTDSNLKTIILGNDSSTKNLYVLKTTDGNGGSAGTISEEIIVTPAATFIGDGEYDLSALTTMNPGDYAYMAALKARDGEKQVETLTIKGETEGKTSKVVSANLINPEKDSEEKDIAGFEPVDIQVIGKLELSGGDSDLSWEKTFMVGSEDETETELKTLTLPDMALRVYPKAHMTLSCADGTYAFSNDVSVYKGGKLTIQGIFKLLSTAGFTLGTNQITDYYPVYVFLYAAEPSVIFCGVYWDGTAWQSTDDRLSPSGEQNSLQVEVQGSSYDVQITELNEKEKADTTTRAREGLFDGDEKLFISTNPPILSINTAFYVGSGNKLYYLADSSYVPLYSQMNLLRSDIETLSADDQDPSAFKILDLSDKKFEVIDENASYEITHAVITRFVDRIERALSVWGCFVDGNTFKSSRAGYLNLSLAVPLYPFMEMTMDNDGKIYVSQKSDNKVIKAIAETFSANPNASWKTLSDSEYAGYSFDTDFDWDNL